MNDFEEYKRVDPDRYYSFIESKINFEMEMSGFKDYSRQYKIGKYSADFYFPKNKLVLEIDGKDFHSSSDQFEHDRRRDKFMNNNGYCVVRVTGSMAYDNPAGILSAIRYLKENTTYFINSERDIKDLMIKSLETFDKTAI